MSTEKGPPLSPATSIQSGPFHTEPGQGWLGSVVFFTRRSRYLVVESCSGGGSSSSDRSHSIVSSQPYCASSNPRVAVSPIS